VAVPRWRILPISTISIHSSLEPSVRLAIVDPGEALPANADLVILPVPRPRSRIWRIFGRETAGISILKAHVRRGGRVLGICGGYQMLGRLVADPDGVEGRPRSMPGLGLLDVHTVLTKRRR